MSTSYTVGSGSGLILFVCATPRVTAITYGGVSMTKVVTFAPSIRDGNQQDENVWRLNNPATGSNTLAITSASDGTCGIVSYKNVNTDVSQPVGNATGYSNNGVNNTQVASLGTSITTTSDRMWTVMFARGANATNNFATGGGTMRTTGVFIFGDGAQGIYDSNGPITPAGSSTLTSTWATSSGFTSNVIISLSPSNNGGLLDFFP